MSPVAPVAPVALSARTELPTQTGSALVLLIGAPTRPAWALYRQSAGFGLDAVAGLFFGRHPVVIVTTPDQLTASSALSPLSARAPLIVPELSAEQILNALRLRPDLARVGGVLTLQEQAMPLVAELAAALHLPGPGPSAAPALAALVRRRHLRTAGIAPSHHSDQAERERLGWGTRRARVTVTAICASTAGDSQLIAIARTLHDHDDGRAVTVLVDPAEPLLTDQRLTVAVTEALAVLQVQTGLTHLRFRLDRDCTQVIEVTSGIGDPMLARLVELAHGLELSALALALATGATSEHVRELTSTRRAGRVAAAALAYGLSAPADERLQDLAARPGLDRLIWQHPLDQLRPLSWPAQQPSGYGIVTGPDSTSCIARLSPLADALDAA